MLVYDYDDGKCDGLSAGKLPPGFRFHPTDEEIIVHYLVKKASDQRFSARAIGEVDLNKCEPWDLPKQAKNGEKEWYFFCQKDRKYPTGMRTNRATESGYWKATGKDKEIYSYRDRKCVVGMKKTLVFYKGRAPKGQKTDWVIHEYRLDPKFSRPAKDEWVVCKVFNKSFGLKRMHTSELPRMDPCSDHNWTSPALPLRIDSSRPSFAAHEDKFKAITSSRLTFNSHRLHIQQHEQNVCSTRSPLSCHNNPLKTPTFCPQVTNQNSLFPSQGTLPPLGYGLSSRPTKPAFKADDLTSLVHPFSSNTSGPSHSQDTEISNEDETGNEMMFDEELEGLAFSPCVSDLGFLWS